MTTTPLPTTEAELPPDEFHAHEALDRAHLIASMLDTHLRDHPFVTANPNVLAGVERASRELGALYQLIGNHALPHEGRSGGAVQVPAGLRDELLGEIVNCPHTIMSATVVLKYDSTKPGNNALHQLVGRIEDVVARHAASPVPPAPDVVSGGGVEEPATDPAFAVLLKLAEQLEIMLGSAQTLGSGEWIDGYQIKTGALHRMIGLLQGAGLAIEVPLPQPAPAAVVGEPVAHIDTRRLAFLHSTNRDAQGYEWGVAAVKFDAHGKVASCLWGLSDSSDIDKLMSAPTLPCKACGADRAKEPCKGDLSRCAMAGTASAQSEGQK